MSTRVTAKDNCVTGHSVMKQCFVTPVGEVPDTFRSQLANRPEDSGLVLM